MPYRKALLPILLVVLASLIASCGSKDEDSMPLPPTQPASTLPAATAPPDAAEEPSSVSQATPDPNAAALVNGETIPLATYQNEIDQFVAALKGQGTDLETEQGQATLDQVKRQVLEGMIDQLLIEQGAAARGIEIPDEKIQSLVASSIEQGGGKERFAEWLAANGFTEEDYGNMIRSQLITDALIQDLAPDLDKPVHQVRLRQILVADEEEARTLKDRLQRGESFDALARKVSLDDGSREQGGDLGWFPKGLSLLPPEVEQAAFSLSVGTISDPLPSGYGYHVIQVNEIDESRPLSVEMVQSLRQQNLLEWLDEQRQQAEIERYVSAG
jgi:foldase protein PrsA